VRGVGVLATNQPHYIPFEVQAMNTKEEILERQRLYQRRYRATQTTEQKSDPEYHRRWREAHPDKWRAIWRRSHAKNIENGRQSASRYRANNRDKQNAKWHRHYARKRKAAGTFTAEQFNALCLHFKNHCLKCGRPRKLTADHVIPLSWVDRPYFADWALGDIDNIQPLCKPCNSGKCATFAVDYRIKPHPNCINPPLVEDFLA
jgi:hypothetical protein